MCLGFGGTGVYASGQPVWIALNIQDVKRRKLLLEVTQRVYVGRLVAKARVYG